MIPLPHRLILSACLAVLPLLAARAEAPDIPVEKAPAPLFDDPVWHGAADPTVIWNEARRQWLMYYTQRRATLNPVQGVDWVHGTAVGIASSPDGLAWKYEGICQGDHDLDRPIEAGLSWWAPSVVVDDAGTFHMYVVRVDGGAHETWGGGASIPHFTSRDGLRWAYQDTPNLSSGRCIDACLERLGGDWWMWYKDEGHGSHIWAAKSPDLKNWTVVGETVDDRGQEAPLVWRWQGRYWMLTDQGGGLRVHTSVDGRSGWQFNTVILDQPGTRPLDDAAGSHPFVLVQGGRALIFYFVHYRPVDPVYADRRTVIQLAELGVGPDGRLTCNRSFHPAAPPASPAKR